MLELALLGPLEVRRVDAAGAGERVALGPPKQRAVLAVLLLEAGRVVSTDRLVDAVWGEEAPGSVLTSLQAYVSNLRRLLRDDARATSPLARQAPGYRCDVDPEQLDVARFAAGSAAADEALARQNWDEAARLASAALRLWRGPVLADLADEEWVRVAAAGLEVRRTACRQTLVTGLLGQDRVAAAAAEAAALAADHPLDERACWLHLVALHRSGRTAAALEAHRAHAERLDEGLGLEPGPALRDLQGALLRQDPDLAVWPRTVVATVPGVVEPAPVRTPAPVDEPRDLVGRDRELAVAAEVLDARTGWLVLAGAPGIGKSRLAEACIGRWEAAGGVVARTACPDFAGLPAWWPVRQVLSELGEDPEVLLVPPSGVDIDAARFATYEAVRARLRAAIQRPVLVLLDDVHWADATSLAFLTLLAESGGIPGLVVLLTARAGVGGPDVARLLAAVARTGTSRHVTLPPLSVPEVVELADRVSGGAVDADEAMALARRTGGNPFFVSEYARLPDDVRRAGGVPGAVRLVLERRLSGVDPDVLAVLRTAAVIGHSLDLDLLGRVTRLDRDDLADVLDDARLTTPLPAALTLHGTTLTWQVPDTALDATSTATFAVKVADDASAGTLAAVADPTTLGATCAACATDQTVSLRQQSLRPRPTVQGKPVVGRKLRAKPGRVDPGTSLTYRWKVGGKAVAYGPTLAVRPAYAGRRVKVTVTARKPGYRAVQGTSPGTSPVRR